MAQRRVSTTPNGGRLQVMGADNGLQITMGADKGIQIRPIPEEFCPNKLFFCAAVLVAKLL